MTGEQDDTVTTINGCGCGLAVAALCTLVLLVNERFWAGLRSVLEVFR